MARKHMHQVDYVSTYYKTIFYRSRIASISKLQFINKWQKSFLIKWWNLVYQFVVDIYCILQCIAIWPMYASHFNNLLSKSRINYNAGHKFSLTNVKCRNSSTTFASNQSQEKFQYQITTWHFSFFFSRMPGLPCHQPKDRFLTIKFFVSQIQVANQRDPRI